MEEVYIKNEAIEIEIKQEPVDFELSENSIKNEPPNGTQNAINNPEENYIQSGNSIFIKEYDRLNDENKNIKIEASSSRDEPPNEPSMEIIGRVYENGKINRLKCNLCEKTYKNRANLKNHLKFVHSEQQFVECGACFKSFKSQLHLRSHIDSVHAKTEEVKCHYCDKMFVNKKKLNNHIYFAHPQPEDQVNCKLCLKPYKSPYYLKIHMRHVHPEGAPRPCPVCYKVFKVEMLLQRHIKWAHPGDGMTYKCQNCKKVLPSLDGYRMHFKNVHSLDKRVMCDICKRAFKTKKSLDRHMKNIHDGKDEKEVKPYVPSEFVCRFCERPFSSTTSLFWHLARYHAQNVPKNYCIICNKDYSDNASLQRHLTSVHSLETATCNICSKEFKSPINLQNHMRITHAPPEKSQICEICDKTFKCPLHLRMHMLAVHTDGVFICDICDKRFSSQKYLNKHKKTHIDSRDHQCDICEKMYKSIHAVTKHKKQVHSGIKCLICNVKQTNIEEHVRKCHPETLQDGGASIDNVMTNDSDMPNQDSSIANHFMANQDIMENKSVIKEDKPDATEIIPNPMEVKSIIAGKQIDIDEIMCRKCNRSISSNEFQQHACDVITDVVVKIEENSSTTD